MKNTKNIYRQFCRTVKIEEIYIPPARFFKGILDNIISVHKTGYGSGEVYFNTDKDELTNQVKHSCRLFIARTEMKRIEKSKNRFAKDNEFSERIYILAEDITTLYQKLDEVVNQKVKKESLESSYVRIDI